MITDLLIEASEIVLEEAKNNLDKIIKIGGVTACLSCAAYVSYTEIKRKYLWQYLNYTIPDIYNPRDLTKHVWISGAQGSGKSNKLRRIFVNSFVKQNWGGIYIDTHGTADIILQSISKERWKDVIYIAPWMGRVWGINILRRYTTDVGEIDRIAADVVDIFHKMYPRSWGDKLANTIRFATKMVLLAEMGSKGEYSNPTLIDVYRVITDEIFRNKLKGWVDNEIITNFFEALKANSAAQKLEDPLSSENILLFLCQEQGIDLYKCMDERKIIICNFDMDYLSTNANLLSGLVISVITQCAAKRKGDASPELHPYFAVALDEFYEYANKHIRVLIEQMRKKNICMLLANQHREQMPSQDIKSAVSMCQFKFIHTPADADINWISNIYGKWFTKEQISSIPYFVCIHDEHKGGKSRRPKINQVPMFKPDFDWDYVKEEKYKSLEYAPERYNMLRMIKKRMNMELISYGEEVSFTGKIIMADNENVRTDGVIEYA
jgi:hypothetical protein